MNAKDRIPLDDRFEDEEDWLDLFDEEPSDPRHGAAEERAEAAVLDDFGLDWTDMDSAGRIEVDLDVADVDDPAEDDIAA